VAAAGSGGERDRGSSGRLVSYGTAPGRWVLLATVLGSGVAFLDGTVVNVALPAIDRDLSAGFSSLQWVVDAYLLTLGALVLVGGSLGDIFGRRRMFLVGLVGFMLASGACGLAPSAGTLIGARAIQGVAAALLVPGSLALLSSTFAPADRSRAVGSWSALATLASAAGPFVGGYLVDAASWRWVFLLNVPLVAVAVAVTLARVPEPVAARAAGIARPRLDIAGAAVAVAGLGLVVFPLIEAHRFSGPAAVAIGASGAAGLCVFLLVEHTRAEPMLPLGLFRSRTFTACNLTTVAVYGALGGALFLLVIELQRALGYSALAAGAALTPITVLLLLLSSPAGRLAGRIGPRSLMTVGPVLAAAGLAMMTRVSPGSSYAGAVLPAAIIFGLGMAATVAPLTAAVLGAVDDARAGVASGVNNAVARVAGLIAVAVLPLVAGLSTSRQLSPAAFTVGFHRAMWVAAVVCLLGGLVAYLGVPAKARVAAPVAAPAAEPGVHR